MSDRTQVVCCTDARPDSLTQLRDCGQENKVLIIPTFLAEVQDAVAEARVAAGRAGAARQGGTARCRLRRIGRSRALERGTSTP